MFSDVLSTFHRFFPKMQDPNLWNTVFKPQCIKGHSKIYLDKTCFSLAVMGVIPRKPHCVVTLRDSKTANQTILYRNGCTVALFCNNLKTSTCASLVMSSVSMKLGCPKTFSIEKLSPGSQSDGHPLVWIKDVVKRDVRTSTSYYFFRI